MDSVVPIFAEFGIPGLVIGSILARSVKVNGQT